MLDDGYLREDVVAAPLEVASNDGDAVRVRERRFLIVTAPFGPFSRCLAAELRAHGARCSRILLNAGDVSEWGLSGAVPYRGGLGCWSGWIADHLARCGVTDLVAHGDSNPYAQAAIGEAHALGVNVHVFEQGYFRPHWITLERDGVNAHSALPRCREHYEQILPVCARPPVPVGKITPAAVARITSYHLCAYAGWVLFPRYRNPHRNAPALQALGHVRRYVNQKLRKRVTAASLRRFMAASDPVFLALLQRPGDSQLTRHSSFETVAEFATHVIRSFATNAPPRARLLFKAHPLDHGLEDHGSVIRRAAIGAGVAERVFFADDGHLPTLLRASQGVISVNSTAGLAALELGLPTIALGQAIYDMDGLTHQDGLNSFWTSPQPPDRALFSTYQATVMAGCQINGAFSTRHGIDLAAPEAARRMLAYPVSRQAAAAGAGYRIRPAQSA